ncbi:unnamed protein product [Prorocentrum cordatum]|uniref:Uncharacterized protein n=1 Tax=Prorocentrum cordatum TaxID=2364126 RepID=A0ABN9Q5K5_9DINO|nr:unnamed protein product [Polarella glacialis]
MSYFGSAFSFALVHYLFAQVYATQSEVYTFESYADAECSDSALTKTDYLTEVTGSAGCYVYTDVNGDVTTSVSSFSLTCSDDSNDYTEYESESCTGPAVSTGTKPWFTTLMCASLRARNLRSTVFTAHLSSSCTKSYLPTR